MRSVGAVHGDGIQRGGEFVLQFGDAFALRGKRRTHDEADAAAEAVRFAVVGGGRLDDEIHARRQQFGGDDGHAAVIRQRAGFPGTGTFGVEGEAATGAQLGDGGGDGRGDGVCRDAVARAVFAAHDRDAVK